MAKKQKSAAPSKNGDSNLHPECMKWAERFAERRGVSISEAIQGRSSFLQVMDGIYRAIDRSRVMRDAPELVRGLGYAMEGWLAAIERGDLLDVTAAAAALGSASVLVDAHAVLRLLRRAETKLAKHKKGRASRPYSDYGGTMDKRDRVWADWTAEYDELPQDWKDMRRCEDIAKNTIHKKKNGSPFHWKTVSKGVKQWRLLSKIGVPDQHSSDF